MDSGVSAAADVGEVRILATDHGVHPPEKWAELTTDTLLDGIIIDPDSSSLEASQARAEKVRLRPKLLALFTDEYRRIQEIERERSTDFLKRYLLIAFANFSAALKDSIFSEHFSKSTVVTAVWRIIGQHIADIMHIERISKGID